MIVLDSSALFAILQDEEQAEACQAAIDAEEILLICAPTLTETLIVAAGRGLHTEMGFLIGELQVEVVSLTEELAYGAVRGFVQWGKGIHPAGLNFGDCFSYALAKQRSLPLLYIGDDFARTDIVSALA